jgi:hypothetical protein
MFRSFIRRNIIRWTKRIHKWKVCYNALMVIRCCIRLIRIHSSTHRRRYSPFWALASLLRRSILLCSLPSSSSYDQWRGPPDYVLPPFVIRNANSKNSFIHLAVCLTTGPNPLPKRALHIVRSRASSFKWEYSLLSLRSSNSFIRLLPCLPVTSIPPCILPSVTRCRWQFLRKMWPIQFAFRLRELITVYAVEGSGLCPLQQLQSGKYTSAL